MPSELTPVEQLAYDAIEEIQVIKREKDLVPDHALMTEVSNSIMTDVKEAINSLVRKGRIEWHKNVNGVLMFGVKE